MKENNPFAVVNWVEDEVTVVHSRPTYAEALALGVQMVREQMDSDSDVTDEQIIGDLGGYRGFSDSSRQWTVFVLQMLTVAA